MYGMYATMQRQSDNGTCKTCRYLLILIAKNTSAKEFAQLRN